MTRFFVMFAVVTIVTGVIFGILFFPSVSARSGQQDNPIAPFEINCHTQDLFGVRSGMDVYPAIDTLLHKDGFAPGKKYKLTKRGSDREEDTTLMYDFVKSAQYPRVSPYINADQKMRLIGYGILLLGDFETIIKPTVLQLNAALDACPGVQIKQAMVGPDKMVTLWVMQNGLEVDEEINRDQTVAINVNLPTRDTLTYAH